MVKRFSSVTSYYSSLSNDDKGSEIYSYTLLFDFLDVIDGLPYTFYLLTLDEYFTKVNSWYPSVHNLVTVWERLEEFILFMGTVLSMSRKSVV